MLASVLSPALPRFSVMSIVAFHLSLSTLWLLLLKPSAGAAVDQRRRDISRLTVRNRSRSTPLDNIGFRRSAATLCKEVAAEFVKTDPGSHSRDRSQRPAHKNSKHESKKEETSHAS